MTRKINIFLLILILIVSCKEKESSDLDELTLLINQMKTDENNAILSSLRPSGESLRLIFKDGESVDKVIAYSNSKWVDFDKVPPHSMKPLTENAELIVLSVSKSELQSGTTKGLPEEYLNISDHLKDGVKLYAMVYLNDDGTQQKMRSAFFKASDTWIIVPLAFKAFE